MVSSSLPEGSGARTRYCNNLPPWGSRHRMALPVAHGLGAASEPTGGHREPDSAVNDQGEVSACQQSRRLRANDDPYLPGLAPGPKGMSEKILYAHGSDSGRPSAVGMGHGVPASWCGALSPCHNGWSPHDPLWVGSTGLGKPNEGKDKQDGPQGRDGEMGGGDVDRSGRGSDLRVSAVPARGDRGKGRKARVDGSLPQQLPRKRRAKATPSGSPKSGALVVVEQSSKAATARRFRSAEVALPKSAPLGVRSRKTDAGK